jgi:hypothetical protein
VHPFPQRDLIEMVRHKLGASNDERQQSKKKDQTDQGDTALLETAPDPTPVSRLA